MDSNLEYINRQFDDFKNSADWDDCINLLIAHKGFLSDHWDVPGLLDRLDNIKGLINEL
jgi:hypothetical protein